MVKSFRPGLTGMGVGFMSGVLSEFLAWYSMMTGIGCQTSGYFWPWAILRYAYLEGFRV